MSDGGSSSFHLLDERIQRFLWDEQWDSLRDAQEKAIPAIKAADRDVIIAAATASGKTEAAFLPALTTLVQSEPMGLIVYISPLKALINDQFGRLDRLCDRLDVPVWPWHGDISASVKLRFMSKREGVLLITPESVEALLCNRGSSVKSIFERLSYIIVDELHAFIGSERGKQLQSLLHRIEYSLGRTVPRIGLSATLGPKGGDMMEARNFLRPGHGSTVELIKSADASVDLKILVKGYEEPIPKDHGSEEDKQAVTPAQIAAHMFKSLRGTNNLIFPNTRRDVERYTYLLNKLCEQHSVPNEFWPHHGSLSKEIRADTEAALKQKERPASAVCTNTLELGIDIGAVESVAQVGPPPSVASLRQRLGRSGRRKGKAAVLRGYCQEAALDALSNLAQDLRLDTVELVAMISLLIERWYEPPRTEGLHLSTLIQQVLSFVSQNGGASIAHLYGLLCAPGAPFAGITKVEFVELIRHLGEKDLLVQESSGVLLHGQTGEKMVNHYSFYAAFTADEEFRIVFRGKHLGTLPVSQSLMVGQRILFAGKTWLVEDIDEQQKTIFVSHSPGGLPPLFSGGPGAVHTKVRQKMKELLEGSEVPGYLDEVARRFLAEGRSAFAARSLASEYLIDQGREFLLLTWLGDAANEALVYLLRRRGFAAGVSGPGVEVEKAEQTREDVLDALFDAVIDEPPPVDMLLADAKNLLRAKWDWALPTSLLQKTYASLHLNVHEALDWIRALPGAPGADAVGDAGLSARPASASNDDA